MGRCERGDVDHGMSRSFHAWKMEPPDSPVSRLQKTCRALSRSSRRPKPNVHSEIDYHLKAGSVSKLGVLPSFWKKRVQRLVPLSCIPELEERDLLDGLEEEEVERQRNLEAVKEAGTPGQPEALNKTVGTVLRRPVQLKKPASTRIVARRAATKSSIVANNSADSCKHASWDFSGLSTPSAECCKWAGGSSLFGALPLAGQPLAASESAGSLTDRVQLCLSTVGPSTENILLAATNNNAEDKDSPAAEIDLPIQHLHGIRISTAQQPESDWQQLSCTRTSSNTLQSRNQPSQSQASHHEAARGMYGAIRTVEAAALEGGTAPELCDLMHDSIQPQDFITTAIASMQSSQLPAGGSFAKVESNSLH